MVDGVKNKKYLRTRRSDRYSSHSQNNTVLTQSVPETTTNDPSPVFPEELFIEIFLRLPVLFLFQLRCVCKSWKTLICTPEFIKRQLMSSTEYPRLISTLVTDKGTEIASYSVESVLKNQSIPVKPIINNTTNMNHYNIIGSCNGFLCLYDILKSNAILWNPCNKFKSLISPPIDHSMYVNQYGFGYDRANSKYKLLVAMQNGRNIASEIVTKIYTFGENSLKIIQNLPCTPNWYLGKCLNSTLNWPVKENGKQGMLLSFDLEKETYKQMSLPQFDEDYFYTVLLDVLQNFLCMCLEYTHQTVVWWMKEYGVAESWTKLMIIPHPIGILNPTTMEPSFVDPLFISKNGIVLVKTMCSKLALYNIRECNRREKQHESAPYLISISGFKYEPHIHIYQESLLSLQW
ncbi:hypothetical protein TSUD_42410 [Trifolium subterraneum]|uniref:F-box domain-containing protein n=1 Tax=Trifolium subterraneum TaxID=3900 RepID=A0A2Z6M3A3_TRISU|nr:hypothetical protein TSUD_42410 [Trifolium subterraneum]